MQEMQETQVRSLAREDPLEKGTANPLQNSCLEYLIDRGTWCVVIHGVTKNRTCLSCKHTHTHTHTHLTSRMCIFLYWSRAHPSDIIFNSIISIKISPNKGTFWDTENEDFNRWVLRGQNSTLNRVYIRSMEQYATGRDACLMILKVS